MYDCEQFFCVALNYQRVKIIPRSGDIYIRALILHAEGVWRIWLRMSRCCCCVDERAREDRDGKRQLDGKSCNEIFVGSGILRNDDVLERNWEI